MSNGWGVDPIITSGGSFALEGVAMDNYLSEADTAVLYERWKEEWGKPIELNGGVTEITTDMVLSVPSKALTKIYGVRLALRLVEAAKQY